MIALLPLALTAVHVKTALQAISARANQDTQGHDVKSMSTNVPRILVQELVQRSASTLSTVIIVNANEDFLESNARLTSTSVSRIHVSTEEAAKMGLDHLHVCVPRVSRATTVNGVCTPAMILLAKMAVHVIIIKAHITVRANLVSLAYTANGTKMTVYLTRAKTVEPVLMDLEVIPASVHVAILGVVVRPVSMNAKASLVKTVASAEILLGGTNATVRPS